MCASLSSCLCCTSLQLGDVAAFEAVLRQLLGSSTTSPAAPPSSQGALSAVPATLLDEPSLAAAAQGAPPAVVPAAAAAGFRPAPPAASIPALGATGGGGRGVVLVGSAATGLDVELLLQMHDKLGALVMNPQVRGGRVCMWAI